ncbi:hypothetical protein [Streptomyces silaceus]|uniref:hypothetical protein n=1 Tax=Streptomyces silaceus TaxID=545123 RepID=UPI0006EB3C6C|nr:hypothetical protein [Streptomyces silaceus]
MSTQNDDYRAYEYWPSKDERRIVALKRTPEVDAMTDEQLVSRHVAQENPSVRSRVVSRDEDGGGTTVAVFARTEETDRLTDEELMASVDEWKRHRRLRVVGDEGE